MQDAGCRMQDAGCRMQDAGVVLRGRGGSHGGGRVGCVRGGGVGVRAAGDAAGEAVRGHARVCVCGGVRGATPRTLDRREESVAVGEAAAGRGRLLRDARVQWAGAGVDATAGEALEGARRTRAAARLRWRRGRGQRCSQTRRTNGGPGGSPGRPQGPPWRGRVTRGPPPRLRSGGCCAPNGPAPAARAAAAVAGELRRRRRGVPRGAVEGGSAARGGPGRCGAGVAVVDWTWAQESRSAGRCARREMAASSDARRGRCIRRAPRHGRWRQTARLTTWGRKWPRVCRRPGAYNRGRRRPGGQARPAPLRRRASRWRCAAGVRPRSGRPRPRLGPRRK